MSEEVLSVRLEALEKRFTDHERRQNGSMESIHDELKEMNRKIDGRPSWAVTLFLTGSVAIIGVLGGLLAAAHQ
ncbi:MAG TPA: hypothetical protein VFK80_04710 [Limnochordia bacterium]|nr:hypothetical protein [Limnochordia bacterium]